MSHKTTSSSRLSPNTSPLEIDNPADMVTVCEACLTEECWKGLIMCEDAWYAGCALIPAHGRV